MNLTVLALKNLRRNTRRSILSLTAISVTAIVMVFMMGLIAWMQQDIRNNITTYIAGDIRIRHELFNEAGEGNPLEFLIDDLSTVRSEIESMPDVVAVSPRMHIGTAIYRDGKTIPAVGMGIDFTAEDEFLGFSDFLIEGRMPLENTREAVFTRLLAEKLNLNLGDKITILVSTRRRSSNAVTLTVTGIAEFSGVNVNQETFFAPLDLVQRATRSGDSAMELLVRMTTPNSDLDALEARAGDLNEGFADGTGLRAAAWNEASVFYNMIVLANLIYGVMGGIFFLLGSTVIINTTIMTVYERRREIGTLGAMGMESKEIVRLFFTEASFLGFFGALIGVLLGYLLSIPVMRSGVPLYDSFMAEFGSEFSSRLYILVQPGTLIYVFVFASIVAAAASFLPARRSSQIKPVEAMRRE